MALNGTVLGGRGKGNFGFWILDVGLSERSELAGGNSGVQTAIIRSIVKEQGLKVAALARQPLLILSRSVFPVKVITRGDKNTIPSIVYEP